MRSFLPPFMTTFFIAMFVLNMQFLWKYIDDIVGKGLEVSIIIELLFYQSLATTPLALILATMIASVMTLGNHAERFELASMKSAGISLMRVMRPLLVATLCIAGISLFFSDKIIPVASLKFKSRLYDIRKQKPALSLDAAQYNYDFQNFVIYIDSKSSDNTEIRGVRFYDHTRHQGNVNQTNAAKGTMYYSDDKQFMIMNLVDGERYEKVMTDDAKQMSTQPFVRMKFKEFGCMFNLKEFEMKETDEDLFKNHYSLLSIKQLWKSIDSVSFRLKSQYAQMALNADIRFYFAAQSTNGLPPEKREATRTYSPPTLLAPDPNFQGKTRFLDQFPVAQRKELCTLAQSGVADIQSNATAVLKNTQSVREGHVLYENEIHRKFALAFACLLFLFIGAPMGAIIRKGGFGWPILIAIIFFTVFFVLSLVGEKMSKSLAWPPYVGMWFPTYILLPLGVLLTWKASKDSKVFDLQIIEKIKSLLQKLPKRKSNA